MGAVIVDMKKRRPRDIRRLIHSLPAILAELGPEPLVIINSAFSGIICLSSSNLGHSLKYFRIIYFITLCI